MKSLVFYVDVEGTLVNSIGNRTVPIQEVIQHIQELFEHGATLYCWSSAGANFAKKTATSLNIESYFQAFLPKPNVLIDDVSIDSWHKLLQVHPSKCATKTLYDYEDALF